MSQKKKKKSTKVCNIHCQWENCKSSMTILTTEYEVFSDHLKVHADDFVLRLKNETENTDTSEEKPIYCCCMWKECSWEGCEDLNDLVRHIMAHGYHTLLKALGDIVITKLNLSPCTIDVDDQYHMLSCMTGPFVCRWNECNTEYLCPNKYYRHVEKHVSEAPSTYDDKHILKRQCCWENCTTLFRDKHKLKEHIRVHTHEKLLACPGCGGLFSNRTKLLDHLSRQNVEAYENFQCSHCLRRCASERLLRDHMRHHVNYLKCPHCDMTCPNPGSLKYHIHYRHSDDRPFSCAMCEHSFKSNSDLIRHEESHLEKCYICHVEGCSYSTKTSHCMKRHMKVTHSENSNSRYVCHICNQTYSRGFGLTKHLKKKHNFSWPSGHPRFRYIEYEDGLFRLQMVRFESAELTERLSEKNNESNQMESFEETTVEVEEESDELDKEEECHYKGEEENPEDEYNDTVRQDINGEEIDYMSTTADMECETIHLTDSTEVVVSSTGEIYLQPKPPDYDASVMTQLIAMSSKTNLHHSSLAGSALVSDLYKRLKQSSKATQFDSREPCNIPSVEDDVQEEVTIDHVPLEEEGSQRLDALSDHINIKYEQAGFDSPVKGSAGKRQLAEDHSVDNATNKKRKTENTVGETYAKPCENITIKHEEVLNAIETSYRSVKLEPDIERDQKWDASQVLLSFTHQVSKKD